MEHKVPSVTAGEIYRAKEFIPWHIHDQAINVIVDDTKRRMACKFMDKLLEEGAARFDVSILFTERKVKAGEPGDWPGEPGDTVVMLEAEYKIYKS